ncbi:MAG: hypothetical protein KDA52_01735 [Planctomycetaceae bacterium]|nr:hypothetical protein [Planctomycetaceae bacterium]
MPSRPLIIWIGSLTAILFLAGTFAFFVLRDDAPVTSAINSAVSSPRLQNFGRYTLWWDTVPSDVISEAESIELASNLRPQDYVGPESCQKCHKKQYEGWSRHAHRRMNVRIEDARVVGDFDHRTMSYLGGQVLFYQDEGKYCMRLVRDEITREYVITQTIGSRFFQYYVGKQQAGPETEDHPLFHEDHVLPLGYWISRDEWVPVVHVHGEQAEDQRHDPFLVRNDWPRGEFADYAGEARDLYRSQCNFCHTTFSAGDMFIRSQQLLARHVPTRVDLSLSDYVQAARPELWPQGRLPEELSDDDFASILKEFRNFDARDHAITLGVSCEACHFGCREHAAGESKKPQFFPHAPEAFIRSDSDDYDLGRTHQNVNWACGRCHAGDRPQLAAGMSTWNSTEYTDAMRGACYSQLTCTKCHDPHETLGQGWSHTAIEDDAICLSCHQEFEPMTARTAHTRHLMNGEGSHCMNCHMPRLNEGLQEVVRTHMIFSPTNSAMIESNQPNACNQCHVDESLQWTLGYLKDWYGKSYSQPAIEKSSPKRDSPAALNWLSSNNKSVRLIAADCLTRAEAAWALPELIDALDDPYLLNRQFAQIGLERMLGIDLSEVDYQFYQMPRERSAPLQQLRRKLLPDEGMD